MGGKIMLTSLIVALVIGAIAGWLAGLLVQGTGFGLLGDIFVGIVGAMITSMLFPKLGKLTKPAAGKVAMLLPALYDCAKGRARSVRESDHSAQAGHGRAHTLGQPGTTASPSSSHSWYVWDWSRVGILTMGWLT